MQIFRFLIFLSSFFPVCNSIAENNSLPIRIAKPSAGCVRLFNALSNGTFPLARAGQVDIQNLQAYLETFPLPNSSHQGTLSYDSEGPTRRKLQSSIFPLIELTNSTAGVTSRVTDLIQNIREKRGFAVRGQESIQKLSDSLLEKIKPETLQIKSRLLIGEKTGTVGRIESKPHSKDFAGLSKSAEHWAKYPLFLGSVSALASFLILKENYQASGYQASAVFGSILAAALALNWTGRLIAKVLEAKALTTSKSKILKILPEFQLAERLDQFAILASTNPPKPRLIIFSHQQLQAGYDLAYFHVPNHEPVLYISQLSNQRLAERNANQSVPEVYVPPPNKPIAKIKHSGSKLAFVLRILNPSEWFRMLRDRRNLLLTHGFLPQDVHIEPDVITIRLRDTDPHEYRKLLLPYNPQLLQQLAMLLETTEGLHMFKIKDLFEEIVLKDRERRNYKQSLDGNPQVTFDLLLGEDVSNSPPPRPVNGSADSIEDPFAIRPPEMSPDRK